MNLTDKQSKVEAINLLLEYSLLFTLEEKKKIKEKLLTLSDEEIMKVGKFLSTEHVHRDELDKILTELNNTNQANSTP